MIVPRRNHAVEVIEDVFQYCPVVLIACSPVFKKIIDNNPSQHPLIYLRGIQSYELESILQFIYLGEAKCLEREWESSSKLPRI